jgi:hypothetical protein
MKKKRICSPVTKVRAPACGRPGTVRRHCEAVIPEIQTQAILPRPGRPHAGDCYVLVFLRKISRARTKAAPGTASARNGCLATSRDGARRAGILPAGSSLVLKETRKLEACATTRKRLWQGLYPCESVSIGVQTRPGVIGFWEGLKSGQSDEYPIDRCGKPGLLFH